MPPTGPKHREAAAAIGTPQLAFSQHECDGSLFNGSNPVAFHMQRTSKAPSAPKTTHTVHHRNFGGINTQNVDSLSSTSTRASLPLTHTDSYNNACMSSGHPQILSSIGNGNMLGNCEHLPRNGSDVNVRQMAASGHGGAFTSLEAANCDMVPLFSSGNRHDTMLPNTSSAPLWISDSKSIMLERGADATATMSGPPPLPRDIHDTGLYDYDCDLSTLDGFDTLAELGTDLEEFINSLS
jgi:hypothetical protein